MRRLLYGDEPRRAREITGMKNAVNAIFSVGDSTKSCAETVIMIYNAGYEFESYSATRSSTEHYVTMVIMDYNAVLQFENYSTTHFNKGLGIDNDNVLQRCTINTSATEPRAVLRAAQRR
ncbi:hypothetical protein EVAR_75171_1 [Eumeta japonica]|uniref:Uncharacterized protein n=1 Tax=Eumeta variegata TaxID=151549 RepID=A0A4C1U0Y7_EUMVA|nr:hypothetical protein EVAR_75171_1 [Eumeta japonica]